MGEDGRLGTAVSNSIVKKMKNGAYSPLEWDLPQIFFQAAALMLREGAAWGMGFVFLLRDGGDGGSGNSHCCFV